MLIIYYANKKSSPRLPSWQPSLIFFNIPIESGSIIKPCTLKHFQVTYRLHKAGYWTIQYTTNKKTQIRVDRKQKCKVLKSFERLFKRQKLIENKMKHLDCNTLVITIYISYMYIYTNARLFTQFRDLSMMYRALWDRRHEGATRIGALTYLSGPWVPPISHCTIHHAEIRLWHELLGFDTLRSRSLQAMFRSMHCRKSMRGFVGHVCSNAFVTS